MGIVGPLGRSVREAGCQTDPTESTSTQTSSVEEPSEALNKLNAKVTQNRKQRCQIKGNV